jgi:hypothetical protein
MPQDDAPLIRAALDRLENSKQLKIRPIELVEVRPGYLVISDAVLEVENTPS